MEMKLKEKKYFYDKLQSSIYSAQNNDIDDLSNFWKYHIFQQKKLHPSTSAQHNNDIYR